MLQRLSLLALLLWTLPLPAQNRELLGEYKIGIVGRDQDNAIYQAAHAGAQAATLELSEKYSIDIELVVFTPNKSQGANQVTALAELFIEDADGLIISPENTDSVRASLEFAIQQGQEVVYFESQLPDIPALASILADEAEAGRMVGRTILKKLPTKARVAILTSTDPSPELKQRMQGLSEVLGYRRIETTVGCEPNYQSAITAIINAEKNDRNDLIKGWVFLEDWPLLGMPALPWAPKELPTVAIQSSPSAFMYVDQGYLDALVVHPYYEWGYRSVEAMVEKLHKQQPPEEKILRTLPRVVDRHNAEDYRESWKQWLK
ncbi:substrate-binding domain-containing protein [Coraliomargarita sp. SDUM461004]|uniref:Substrate-binding domain-containing protein n=1 Tax=Thalassobacterium sedimentorum TaxID=3041258 RepID=A0ABU1AF58_9BACT|nr:substrate-binding domain-containing protein [Coraliomargarita sp. SDUM461004]MDQ8193436.1 substrate-binding domain-containing protein [Coraliomargarita sp. SDUM461004]